MRIVISGYYGFHNIGDEAILYSIIQSLKSYEQNVKITVLSNDPEFTRHTYGVDAVNRWNIKEVLHSLKKSDGLISGGGSLLQDQTGWKSIPYYTGIMALAKIAKKPIFVYAQGMGPINKVFSKRIVNLALNRVSAITVRDERSKELLKSLNVIKPIGLVPDPVLGLSVGATESEWINSLNTSKQFIVVSVRDWQTKYAYLKNIADSLSMFIEDYQVILLPMHGKHDEETSKKLNEMLDNKALIAPYEASIQEKIAIIGNGALLIGMRLHALIFAAITNTPFIALSYDPKIDVFTEQANQVVAGHVEINNWSAQTLADEITKVLHQSTVYKERLEKATATLKSEAIQTASQAIQVFRNQD
ncbi:polysaccharide pyruvyl transferase CsaB [Bacillus pinisoli]|uniref:polysaccharide pyruvyl transferase CsaB n=1 Tax=Bacillus pinisoli TaxID=2901866 RepID=UPI001FF3BF77|nr:polysaccharide pyruvyl transferase CsaB [Bacillus pinisoli]